MNILYCGDEKIADGLLISILSLLKNVEEPLHIYILTAGITTGRQVYRPLSYEVEDALNRMVREHCPENFVSLYDISNQFCRELPGANLNTRFTPCCMLRLYADMLPQLPERILYLDNDVVCRSDCLDFYLQDMEGYELAGVPDYYGKWLFHRKFLRFDYFNSGVLLLNLKKIRETGLFVKCREYCARRRMFMPDQSAIHKLAKWKKALPRRYNEQRKLQEDTVFQHFTTSFRMLPWLHTVTVKPWQIDKMHQILKLHEYDDLLLEYTIQKNNISL